MCSNSQVHLHMRAAKHTLVHTIAHRHDFPLACEPAIGASRETTDSQGKVLMVSNICQECSKAGTVGYCVCTGDTHFRTALQVWCVIVLFEKIFFYIWNLSESLDLKWSKGNSLKIWLFEKDRWIKRAEERTEELRLYCNCPVNVM